VLLLTMSLISCSGWKARKEPFMLSKNNGYERLSKEFLALTEISKTLTSPLELPELFDAVMKKIVSVVEQADIGAIMLWDQSTGLFRPAAAVGYDLGVLKEIGLRPGESITGKAFDEGQTLLLRTEQEITQAMADMRPFNRQVMMRSIGNDVLPHCAIAAPIRVGEQKFGVLVLEALDSDNNLFNEADLPFVQTLADLVALAIDRVRLEARADSVRETRHVEQTRSELMATLSHELRKPLATIKGYATALLLDEMAWGESKQKEFLHLIEEACNDMEGMLKDILDAAAIEREQFKLERQPLHLQKIANELGTEIQHRSKIHRTLVDFPPDFPVVQADPRWIKQVFRNILDNAVKYSPQGGLIVVRGEARSKDVVVSVADQGIGIAPADQIPLFEKYFRVRAMETAHIPGIGLGLPIARAILEAHAGRIWVESKLGEGTTVYFSLPHSEPLK
jgi:K+-sensing histidine kinase KdpD